MTTYNNYYIILPHPVENTPVECLVSFCHTEGYRGSFFEPPEDEDVEINKIVLCSTGEDVTMLFSPAQLYEAESMLLAAKMEEP